MVTILNYLIFNNNVQQWVVAVLSIAQQNVVTKGLFVRKFCLIRCLHIFLKYLHA